MGTGTDNYRALHLVTSDLLGLHGLVGRGGRGAPLWTALRLGPRWRVLGVGEPSGVEELLVRAVVVADKTKFLPLPHPPHHDLHLPLAGQLP
jgi:hypothetical protein